MMQRSARALTLAFLLSLLACSLGVGAAQAQASTGAGANTTTAIALDHAPDHRGDPAALRHGAQLYATYCLNCHSAQFVRYGQWRTLGFSSAQIQAMTHVEKMSDPLTSTLRPDEVKAAYGAVPPDLSLEAHARSRDWLYTYLRSFYPDSTRPSGWNNRVARNTAMPHMLAALQGTLPPSGYDASVADLVAYLAWMAEPERQTRERIGVGVLAFLAVLSFLMWRLSAACWKDIR